MDYSMVIGSQFLNNRIGTHRDAADEDLFYQAHAFEYFPKSRIALHRAKALIAAVAIRMTVPVGVVKHSA